MYKRKDHIKFDEYLSERGVLLEDAGYDKVHAFMDAGVKSFGAQHRLLDPFHKGKGLRSWLNGQWNVIGQDRATDWLRAGLGHICLDEADTELDLKYSVEEVFDSAYRSMVQRGWTKARFVRH